ncbi:MAG: DUF928 domain-containing protein [Rivularia sp. (in: Bacteria)]|nr:DUF928 domain-containing protein [Rivularia sp. MS3]
MFQLNKISFILLFILIYAASGIPARAAIRTENQTHSYQRENIYLALSWSDIVKIFRRKKSRKGGKGSICLIVPQRLDDPVSKVQGTQEIWSLNPRFLWNISKGKVNKIELFDKNSNQAFWSQQIPEGKTSFAYNGKPLEPGKSYQWRVIAYSPFQMKSIPVEFKVMEAQKRSGITIRLALLEHQIKKQGANAEKIALEKANYFAKEELWSDVIREIYQVQNPSRRLKQRIKQIQSSDYCNSTGTLSYRS